MIAMQQTREQRLADSNAAACLFSLYMSLPCYYASYTCCIPEAVVGAGCEGNHHSHFWPFDQLSCTFPSTFHSCRSCSTTCNKKAAVTTVVASGTYHTPLHHKIKIIHYLSPYSKCDCHCAKNSTNSSQQEDCQSMPTLTEPSWLCLLAALRVNIQLGVSHSWTHKSW